MAKQTPVVHITELKVWDEYIDQEVKLLDIAGDWEHWQEWLDREVTKSFRYVGQEGGTFTVVKELRPHFGKKDKLRPVWYAHKRLVGKLKRRYLGKSENLTYDRLKAVAF